MPRLLLATLAAISFSSITTAASDIAVANPSFEEAAMPGSIAPGWQTGQHWAPTRSYEWAVDKEFATEGKASFRIKRLTPQSFGMIRQRLQVSEHAGKTLEFSAMMKTVDVGPKGWVLVVNVENRNAILEQLRSDPVAGKQDWKRQSLRLKLPADVFEIQIGVMLLDTGTGWVDDIKLRVVD